MAGRWIWLACLSLSLLAGDASARPAGNLGRLRIRRDQASQDTSSTFIVISNAKAFVDALSGSEAQLNLSLRGLIKITTTDLNRAPDGIGSPIELSASRNITVSSETPQQPATLDWGNLLNVVHLADGASLGFQNVVVQGFASQFNPQASQLTRQTVGDGSWPTITAEPGAEVVYRAVTAYTALPDCSDFATSVYAQARKALGNDSIRVLGPSTLFVNGTHTLTLPVKDVPGNATIGTISAMLAGGVVSICTRDELAPENVAPVSNSSSSTPGWVWATIAVASLLVVAAAAAGLVLVSHRKRRRRKAATARNAGTSMPAASGSLKESQELQGQGSGSTLGSLPRGTSLLPSELTAEAALLEAWRNQQLANDSAPDEVELGPLIGRGGFGRVHKARWRGSIVAVKIVPHSADGNYLKDIKIYRETLFSTSILHPNIVVTFKILTLPSISHRGRTTITSGGSLPSTANSGSGASEGGRVSAFAMAAAAARSSVDFAGGGSARNSGSQPGTARAGSVGSDQLGQGGAVVRIDTPAQVDDEELNSGGGGQQQFVETWMLQEYCDRGSLDKAIQHQLFRLKSGQPDMVKVYRCLMDIAGGMSYLHDAGILHGDLKAGNILLRSSSSDIRGLLCKVADFGTSRLLDSAKTHVSTDSFGTVSYMPPELLSGAGLTKKADVYSFGILMWELFSGEVAFAGKNLGNLIFMVVHQQVRPPLPEDCPAGFAALMMSCWQHDPARRPTFRDVLETLQRHHSSLRSSNSQTLRSQHQAPPPRPGDDSPLSISRRSRQDVVYSTVEIDIQPE